MTDPWQSVEQIGDCTLYLGDCLEILPTLGKVDAVVTDPPFFAPAMHYQSRIEYQRTWADMKILEVWWSVVSDKIKLVCPEGHVLVFCNSDSFPAFYPPMFGRWRKLVSLVWDKIRPGLGRVWRHQHELIIAARGHEAYEPDDGRLRGDVLHCEASLSADREHPVEKPAAMLAELVEATSPPRGFVLDPFMGSGTTGVACVRLGRRFIGIEIDPGYYQIAVDRIRAADAQGDLFRERPRPKAVQAALDLGQSLDDPHGSRRRG